MRADSGFLVISHSPFLKIRNHRGPVTAVLLARLIARAPPCGSDNGERKFKTAGTAVKDGEAIAREISCAKPPIGKGPRWSPFLCLLHSHCFQFAAALWRGHDTRPVSQETGCQTLICVKVGKGGAEAPPEFITRKLTSGARRPCGQLWRRRFQAGGHRASMFRQPLARRRRLHLRRRI